MGLLMHYWLTVKYLRRSWIEDGEPIIWIGLIYEQSWIRAEVCTASCKNLMPRALWCMGRQYPHRNCVRNLFLCQKWVSNHLGTTSLDWSWLANSSAASWSWIQWIFLSTALFLLSRLHLNASLLGRLFFLLWRVLGNLYRMYDDVLFLVLIEASFLFNDFLVCSWAPSPQDPRRISSSSSFTRSDDLSPKNPRICRFVTSGLAIITGKATLSLTNRKRDSEIAHNAHSR